jgi:hypothetical protein
MVLLISPVSGTLLGSLPRVSPDRSEANPSPSSSSGNGERNPSSQVVNPKVGSSGAAEAWTVTMPDGSIFVAGLY